MPPAALRSPGTIAPLRRAPARSGQRCCAFLNPEGRPPGRLPSLDCGGAGPAQLVKPNDVQGVDLSRAAEQETSRKPGMDHPKGD